MDCRTMNSKPEILLSLDLSGTDFMRPVPGIASARAGNPVNDLRRFTCIL